MSLTGASYRLLPGAVQGPDARYGDGRLSVTGVINPQGRPGRWFIKINNKPDFSGVFGTVCGTSSGSDAFGGINDAYESADIPVSWSATGSTASPTMKPECWVAPQSQPSPLYVRLEYSTQPRTYSDGQTYPETDGCGNPGTPMPGPSGKPCVSNTLVVPMPPYASPPSKKQVQATLRGALAPKGAGAKAGSILKKGYSTVAFTAPSAGTTRITWSRGGAVAKGTQKVSRAGKTTIKVKLTKRGRTLLKRAKRSRKRLSLKAAATFTGSGPSGVGTVKASRSIKLKN